MSCPLVSVIVPNYNHARHLRKRLDSVLAQTFRDYELLLMDDCSTDESRSILQTYADAPNARLLLNDINSGSPFKQWKKGVAEARGKYVWIAESDDFAAPTLLQRLVDILEAHPRVGIAYCESNVVNELDEIQGTTHNDFKGVGDLSRWTKDFVADGEEECANYLVQMNVIQNASAAVFRRETYVQAGGVDDLMRLCGDWKLWAKMLLKSDLAHVAEPLNFFRNHSQNVRSSTGSWQSIIESVMVVDLIRRSVAVNQDPFAYARNWLADSWIRGWLHRRSDDVDKRSQTLKKLKEFDPAFGRRVMMRVIVRSLALVRKGRVLHWFTHVVRRSGAKSF